jgi:microcystin-dependent protein
MLKKTGKYWPMAPSVLLVSALVMLPEVANACGSEPYVGEVCTFAIRYCPQGYLPADGRAVPVSSYQALYALIGTIYGGDTTNFKLPDLRGRTAVGTGTGTNLPSVVLGQNIGVPSVILNAAQVPIPVHIHPAIFAATTGSQSINIPATTGNLNVAASLPVSTNVGTTTGTISALSNGNTGYLAGISGKMGTQAITITGPYTTIAPQAGASATLPTAVTVTGNAGTAANTVNITTVTGGSVSVGSNTPTPATQAVSTQSPSLGLTACIAVQGLWPSQP